MVSDENNENYSKIYLSKEAMIDRNFIDKRNYFHSRNIACRLIIDE